MRNRRQRLYRQRWRRLRGHRALLRVPSGEQWLTHRTQNRPCTRCGFPRHQWDKVMGIYTVYLFCFVLFEAGCYYVALADLELREINQPLPLPCPD